MKTDIEIARSVKFKNINDIAKQIKVGTEQIYNYGKHIDIVDGFIEGFS